MAGKDCLVLFMIVILFVNSEALDYVGSFAQQHSISRNNEGPCSVYIRTELPEREPLFISNNYSLMVPRNGYLYWQSRETSLIACPSSEYKSRYPQVNSPSFKADGFAAELHPGTVYSSAYTERILRTYPYPANKSYDSGYRLQKGLLTPQGDQLFTSWQFSTYYYINVAGMWNTIITGNWKKVEDSVRSFANRKSRTLDIFTGTYGILRLFPDSPELTLENKWVNNTEFKTSPVPKWVWKIVKDPIADAAIALVVSNNPFVNATRLCPYDPNDPYGNYEPYGWHHEDYDNYRNGLVSICTVKKLKKVFGYIPQEADAKNILKI